MSPISDVRGKMRPEVAPRRWTEADVHALGLHTDVPTAAAILGIGRSTAYDLIHRGAFPVPVVRVGSRIRVPVRPLLALLSGEPP